MTKIELLKADAEYAYSDLMVALEGVTEAQAWAVLPNLGPDYLHSDGSIHGLVHHIAGGKKINGSVCFRNTEFRWRDIYADAQRIEPSWEKALEYLAECHDYWMGSWADITDDQLQEMRPTNWKTDRTVLEILRIITLHDTYHGGQIAVVRYGAPESTAIPPSIADDVLKYCRDLPNW
jgi:uncharacterized damage-inducible protein DinB